MIKNYSIYSKENLIETTIANPNLSIVLPGGCNGKCDFCFWKKTKPCNNYLEKINNILTGLPSQFHRLSITGGEPTMSPYLNKILEMIDKNIFDHTVLTSNGHKLFDVVPILEGKIDHVNISRHHYNDDINNSIFKSKMITTEKLKDVTKKLNEIGIDVTFSAVLNEYLNNDENIKKYIDFAKKCGASQVFFRKPHGTLEPSDVEKIYENYDYKESYCPVCRTKNQIIENMKVSWKSSLEEPSKELGFIYELVVNENGDLTKDWEGSLKVNIKNISENYNKLYEDCGGGGGFDYGCSSGDSDDIDHRETIKEIKKKKEKIKFKIGDKLRCIEFKVGKLDPECVEYLKTYKYYKVLDVKEDFNIDIGYITPNGKRFYFSPNRFEKININDPYNEENWDN